MNTDMKSVNIINHPLTVPKFHGHMKLELRGSRETEVIEHDNNMTNALEILLDSYGLWMNPGEVMNALCPTIKNAFGGILLTDKTLEDGCVAVPGGTEVTACAAYRIANADQALTQGSYNESESVLDLPSKKMTYVYDWATNQGNGTIAAAALTNINGGVCVYGDSGLNINNSYEYSFSMNSSYMHNRRYSPANTILCLVNDEYEIYARINNNTLKIYKTQGVVKSVLPFNVKNSEYNNILSYMKYEMKEYKTSDLNNVKNTYTDGINVYFLNNTEIYAGNTFILYKLNTVDMTLEEININNMTERTLYTNYGFEVYKDYIYTTGYNDNDIYEININNPTDANRYETGLTSKCSFNKLINLCNGKIYLKCSNRVVVFDTITKSIKVTKHYFSSTYRVCNKSICMIYDISSGTTSEVYRLLPILYLATNNNLDKQVTKTPDKTMKVTYTIQEE